MDDPHARRDAAHNALLAAIAEGDATAVEGASWPWVHALDDANVAGLTLPIEILRWSEDESNQVLAVLDAALLAGPDVTDRVVRAVVGLTPPNRGALTRPLTVRQLISSAWTAAVRRWEASGSAPGWWTTSTGRTVVAAMAESCCTMHPYDDVDVGAALHEVPAAGGSVPLDAVLGLDLADQDVDLHGEAMLSFVLRAAPSPVGVSWWPAPPEHVIGYPEPLPTVPASVEAALGVPAVYVYGDEAFCPAPLLPIGHGRRALPDLEALDSIARDHGTEVLSALGTLSSEGVQLVVRTLGPTALFAEQPGVVSLTGDQRAR